MRSRTATLTLRNYRCFDQEKPGVIELRPGITCFVGPNNSGKSTILRVSRELHGVFSVLGEPPILTEMSGGNARSLTLNDVEDPAEIVHRGSDGPVMVEVRSKVGDDAAIGKIVFKTDTTGNRWDARAFSGQEETPISQEHFKQYGFKVLNRGGGLVDANLSALRDIGELLTRSIYIPAFRHALQVSGGSHPDLSIGVDFVNKWHDWQAGQNIANRQRLRKVIRDVGELLGLPDFNIQVAAGASTLQVSVGGRDFRLRELGAGITQFLVILGNVAFRRPSIIFVDEPELNLHPSLQNHFVTTLATYADYGVVFATHSIGLARSAADHLYSVASNGARTEVTAWESTPNLTEFLGEMSYSAYRELGHECVLCVEGPNDIKPIRQILRLMRKEHSTVVIPLGGDNVGHESTFEAVSQLSRTARRLYILLDSERIDDQSAPAAPKSAFRDKCIAADIPVHLTEKRALENYFTDAAIKKVLGEDYRALQPFERLRDAQPTWGKYINWRIVGEMTLADIQNTDVGHFLRNLS